VVYTLGYMGMRQPQIFRQQDRLEPPSAESDTRDSARPKYERSALDADMSAALLQDLRVLMETDKPYLDSTLTLAQLAEQLGISPNYLSQIINQQTGSNFFDYINGHRVEAAKQLLADPAKARLNVLTVAMDAGFNSKSAFYTAFKHHADMTPSQYRQRNLS
jgi:AraC-like DNA-binding protein